MSSISMTTLLGVAAIVGPAMLAIFAHSEDAALATKQCVGENCVTANGGGGKASKKLAKAQKQKSGDPQKIVDEKSESVQGMVSVEPNRISCGDGRSLVAKRFNHVRIVKCKGGTFTYLGRRDGVTFRILVDRGTGRVVGRAPPYDLPRAGRRPRITSARIRDAVSRMRGNRILPDALVKCAACTSNIYEARRRRRYGYSNTLRDRRRATFRDGG